LNLTGFILDLSVIALRSQRLFRESFELVSAQCLNLTGLFLESPRYWRAPRRLFRESFKPSLEI